MVAAYPWLTGWGIEADTEPEGPSRGGHDKQINQDQPATCAPQENFNAI
jgi:hypothetical protein